MKVNLKHAAVTLILVGTGWACGSDPSSKGSSNGGGLGGDGTSGATAGTAGTVVGVGGSTDPTCVAYGLHCASGFDCCSGLCDGATNTCVSLINHCQPEGRSCGSPTDCCSMNCTAGKCGATQCISDGSACTTHGECCGQSCSNGVCAPLNPSCSTAGNACSSYGTCCSKLCQGGICLVGASYCIQNGDICSRDNDCCSGGCNIAEGKSIGTCGLPLAVAANCDGVEGTVCSGCGDCCSRLCAPFGPSGVKICQPASGCRVVGELCLEDKDCCGGDPTSDLPGAGNGSCERPEGSFVGRCRNVQSCSPQGNICHFKEYSCSISSAPNKCCDGVGNSGVCQLDPLGVPRCNGLGTTCRAMGEECASADDCCDDAPCVRDGAGVLRCTEEGSCVGSGGACTINADCCPGWTCLHPQGSTSGICGIPRVEGTGGAPSTGGASGQGGASGIAGSSSVSAGTTSTGTTAVGCASYGQRCSVASDCCNDVPCDQGVCREPILL